MNDTLLSLLLAGLALLAAGAPLGIALTRSVPVGLVLAPVLAGLVYTVAAGGAILTQWPLLPWAVGVIVAALALAVEVGRRDRVPIELSIRPVALVILVVCTLPAMAFVFRAPVGWDARTIWWFHAEWMEEGGDGFTQAMGDEALNWSHADYPPYSSAAVASVRTLTPDPDPSRTAQATSALLSWSALVLVGIALTSTFAGALGRRNAALDGTISGAILIAFAGFVVDDRGITSGYVDYLWACLLAVAAVLLLIDRPSRSSVLLGSLALAAVALTKNEGLLCAAILVALALLRHRRQWREMLPVALALGPGLAWAALARLLGAESDLAEQGNLSDLVAGDSAVWSRLRPTLDAMADLTYSVPFVVILVVASATAGLGAIALTAARRRARLGSDLWLWVLIGGVLGSIVVAFLISPADIDWHLGTALNRTMLAPALLLLVSLAIWLRVALDVVARREPLARPETGAPPSTHAVDRPGLG